MKKLISINKLFYLFLALIAVLTLIMIISLFCYKIDQIENIVLKIDEKKQIKVLGQNNLIYKLDNNQMIKINIDNHYFNLKIKNIFINNLGEVELHFYELPSNFKLIPNSTIIGKIITEKITIFAHLFNS